MSHPDPSAPPDLRPIEPGEVFENPVTRERAMIIELPWQNTEGRAVAEMTALPGARVVGEHLHPAIHESFSVLQGELTVSAMGSDQRSVQVKVLISNPGCGTTGSTSRLSTRSYGWRSRRESGSLT